jgi:uncharacterized protein
MMHIMVDDMEAALALAAAPDAQLVEPVGADAAEIPAYILDPGGNVIGLYQHGGSRK